MLFNATGVLYGITLAALWTTNFQSLRNITGIVNLVSRAISPTSLQLGTFHQGSGGISQALALRNLSTQHTTQ